MVNKALFSSNSDEWATPIEVFQQLDNEFCFNLDPCASDFNHKCETYYTAENDGLSHTWGGIEYSVIRLTARLISGWRKHTERVSRITRLLFYSFRQGQIQDTFTISYISEQRYGLSRGD